MFVRLSFVLSVLFFLSGCVYVDEPMPEVYAEYSSGVIRTEPADVLERVDFPADDVPGEWIPPLHLEHKWTAVVIHHSGTDNGNVAIFDKWHRQDKHWEGVGYDFVIGNGTDSTDGAVEVTFRWRNQMVGAHCGGTSGNWANKYSVGICLVGNFNKNYPTSRQMRSLVKLIGFLQGRYGISTGRIYGHNTTPGARPTECPGRNFSIAALKRVLGN